MFDDTRVFVADVKQGKVDRQVVDILRMPVPNVSNAIWSDKPVGP
jgi:hypothetical protein